MAYYPVANPQVTSRYGPRNAPKRGASTNHKGVDFRGKVGDPVFAPSDLKIASAGTAKGYGNLITATDAQGNTHYFGHLSGFNTQAGATVPAGSVIGAVGNTGNSTGPHLHYGVKDNKKKWLDPMRLLTKGLLPDGKVRDTAIKIGVKVANAVVPFSGDVFTAITGEGGEKSWIEKLQDWIKETQIFQRIAYVIIALIFIGGAIALLGAASKNSVLPLPIKG